MNQNSKHKNPKRTNTNFQIPKEGSLGLLALGYVGLKLWREKRDSK